MFTMVKQRRPLGVVNTRNNRRSSIGRRREREREREKREMSLVWLEAALPLGIIAGMLCVMGNAQYYIHKAAHGRVFLSIYLYKSSIHTFSDLLCDFASKSIGCCSDFC